jgi:hypothetical protein
MDVLSNAVWGFVAHARLDFSVCGPNAKLRLVVTNEVVEIQLLAGWLCFIHVMA